MKRWATKSQRNNKGLLFSLDKDDFLFTGPGNSLTLEDCF